MIATLHAATGKGQIFNAQAMYFSYFMAVGAYLPFINLYYQRLGLTGPQIGLLAALPALVGAGMSLIGGGIADLFRAHRAILRLALLLAAMAALAISVTTRFERLLLLVPVFAVFVSPILPIMDSAALETAERHQRTFGKLRAWGTVGWSIATWLVGTLIERTSLRLLFYCYAGFVGLTFLFSLFQPARRQVLQSPLRHGLRQLLLRGNFAIFLFCIFLLATTMGAMMPFFSLYLDGIGAGEGIIGLAWTLASLSEIPMLLFSGAIVRRISARGLLKVAFTGYALRWLLLSFTSEPVGVLLTQPMHGLSFGAFLVGGVTYVNERTPEGLSTTAQAALNTFTVGLASTVGALAGGYLFDRVEIAVFFRLLSLIAALGLGIFWSISQSPTPDQRTLPTTG